MYETNCDSNYISRRDFKKNILIASIPLSMMIGGIALIYNTHEPDSKIIHTELKYNPVTDRAYYLDASKNKDTSLADIAGTAMAVFGGLGFCVAMSIKRDDSMGGAIKKFESAIEHEYELRPWMRNMR